MLTRALFVHDRVVLCRVSPSVYSPCVVAGGARTCNSRRRRSIHTAILMLSNLFNVRKRYPEFSPSCTLSSNRELKMGFILQRGQYLFTIYTYYIYCSQCENRVISFRRNRNREIKRIILELHCNYDTVSSVHASVRRVQPATGVTRFGGFDHVVWLPDRKHVSKGNTDTNFF